MAATAFKNFVEACSAFPEPPLPEVFREPFLGAIDASLKSGFNLVSISGHPGIGKSTLLSQFARRHPKRAISIFINTASRYGHDPDYLRLVLLEQVCWALGRTPPASAEVDSTYLNSAIVALRRKSRREGKAFVFVIDGLEDVSEVNPRLANIIFQDIVPVGLPGFAFLLSGPLSILPESSLKATKHKQIELVQYTHSEAEEYFADLKLARSAVKQVYSMCSGTPGYLASVRRLLASGQGIDEILDENPREWPDFLGIECRGIQDLDTKGREVLALVAFDQKGCTPEEIAGLLDTSVDEVNAVVSESGVTCVDTEKVRFVSEAHKRYVAKQLSPLKDKIVALLVKSLAANSEEEALYLPTYLEQAGKLNDLVDFLSPNHFAKIMEQSQSLDVALERAGLGLFTARKLEKLDSIIAFAVQRSLITGFNAAEYRLPEIRALMALSDHDEALSVARSATLSVDRLHLLSIIARMKREKGLLVDDDLRQAIRNLAESIDAKQLGKRVIDIAAELIWIDSDLAISLVESATGSENDVNALDHAFMKLSIRTIASQKGDASPSEILEKTSARIKDPDKRQISAVAGLLMSDYEPAEILAKIARMETKNRLFFLRVWAVNNQHNKDAREVMSFALDHIAASAENTATLRDLREVASPLPAVENEELLRPLIERVDSLAAAIGRAGTSQDATRLQLLIAHAETRFDFAAAENRVEDICLQTAEIGDVVTQGSCWSWIYSALSKIDPERQMEKSRGIHTLVEEELQRTVGEILEKTADHIETTADIRLALAEVDPGRAFELIARLNTEARRDEAFASLVTDLVAQEIDEERVATATNAIRAIVDVDVRGMATLRFLERIKDRASVEKSSLAANLDLFFDLANGIDDSFERAQAFCVVHALETAIGGSGAVAKAAAVGVAAAWDDVDVGWERVKLGFTIATRMAEDSPSLAREYLEKAYDLARTITIDSRSHATPYLLAVRLAIHAYSGLLTKRVESRSDLDQLATYIDRIPSHGMRAIAWAELATLCHAAGREEHCNEVVASYVRPLIESLPESDGGFRGFVMSGCSPALYVAHQNSAIQKIDALQQPQRDECYSEICRYLITKRTPSDPIEQNPGYGFAITYEQAIDTCAVLERMSTDFLIYGHIDRLCESLISPKSRFTNENKAEIARRLETIAREKFPDARNISHDGYTLLTRAQVARLLKDRDEVWKSIIADANMITNLSDRGFVCSLIVGMMPSRAGDLRKRTVEQAIDLVAEIPCQVEKADRYLTLSEAISSFDAATAKELARKAFELTTSAERDDDQRSRQRRIVDVAHRIDPEFAASLISEMDEDPARRELRHHAKRRLQLLELGEEVSRSAASGTGASGSPRDQARVAWRILGSLYADRRATVHAKSMVELVVNAADHPFLEMYSIYAWFVGNAVLRLASTDEAATAIAPMYTALLKAVDLAGSLAMRRRMRKYDNIVSGGASGEGILVASGERLRAMEFLRDWLSTELAEYLIICDPYFRKDDIGVLMLVKSASHDARVTVLTGRYAQKNDLSNLEEAYTSYWKQNVSDDAPPETEVVVVGSGEQGHCPIHDRWWLTRGAGLRMGASLNSIGMLKASEITRLTPAEVSERLLQVRKFVDREVKAIESERVRYTVFEL